MPFDFEFYLLDTESVRYYVNRGFLGHPRIID